MGNNISSKNETPQLPYMVKPEFSYESKIRGGRNYLNKKKKNMKVFLVTQRKNQEDSLEKEEK